MLVLKQLSQSSAQHFVTSARCSKARQRARACVCVCVRGVEGLLCMRREWNHNQERDSNGVHENVLNIPEKYHAWVMCAPQLSTLETRACVRAGCCGRAAQCCTHTVRCAQGAAGCRLQAAGSAWKELLMAKQVLSCAGCRVGADD